MGNVSLKAIGLIILLVGWFMLGGMWQVVAAIVGILLILLG